MDPLGNPPIEDPNPDPDSLVWSMGHRNVQGLAWDARGRLWATEFGQNAFDEVNLIEPGGNYGWPEVEGVGDDTGFVDPHGHLDHRRGQPVGRRDRAATTLYVGALRGQRLWTIPLSGRRAGRARRQLLARTSTAGCATSRSPPDGSLWITTSNRDGRGDPDDDDDRVLRLDPDGGS